MPPRDLTGSIAGEPGDWQLDWRPFDHPVWVAYSSATTGLPNPIVDGHGGIVLKALRGNARHNDLAPTVSTGERFHWFSTTGWVTWNLQVGALLGCATICLFDGNPGGPVSWTAQVPDWGTL